MRSGTLTERIAIEEFKMVQDPVTGGMRETWEKVYDAWADIKHLSGLETIRNAVPTSQVKASIRLRYRSGLKPSMRIVHGATVYEIDAILPGKHRFNKYITFVCTTIGNET